MKVENINGKVVVINETREESIEVLTDMLGEYGLEPLTETELNDWGIIGGETNDQLQEWVNDYVSEIHSEMCAEQNQWRYEI